MELERLFRELAPDVDFCSLRYESERSESLHVRQDVPLPVGSDADVGAMVTVIDKGGLGYAATPDLSRSGLERALRRAADWAKATAGHGVTDFSAIEMPHPTGSYATPVEKAWDSLDLASKVDMLVAESKRLKTDDRVVDWQVGLDYNHRETVYLTSEGGKVEQSFDFMVPGIDVTAHADGETISRSLGGRGACRQGGLEVLDAVRFREVGPELVEDALALLSAPPCPSGDMDLVLAPDQMILQVHESIGHPLELDRILGDERNYAGRSFVTLDMFGSFRYGSDLLNITHDPSRPFQFASYAFDDEGSASEREYLIQNGILVRALGGCVSQHRAGVPGVANSRASSWNRPPIDRMANVNLEPGTSSLEEMIGSVENGVYMKTNTSWSIDDSRNKFQFGCEWGQRIENGRLTHLVKKPNYRGISRTFWRNLAAVGNEDTLEVLGTPNCGKGEPSQAARAGHAAPACLFRDTAVFGGE